MKNSKLINNIENIIDIKLLPYEKEFLDLLIEAKNQEKRLIVNVPRGSNFSLSRALLIYNCFLNYNSEEIMKSIEKRILYGESTKEPKGLIETIKKGW